MEENNRQAASVVEANSPKVKRGPIIPGERFSKLTAVRVDTKATGHHRRWICRCDCGVSKSIFATSLRCGDTTSCGCINNSENLIGRKFGKWKVLRRDKHPDNSNPHWWCRCECGTEGRVPAQCLVLSKSQSCGCMTFKWISENRATHGHTKGHKFTSIYGTWAGIKDRTSNPNNAGWKNYGGRGIHMCDRWFNSFEDFLADMGERPSPLYSIGRIDNDGNYEPGNCEWQTTEEQLNNTRRNVWIEHGGERKTASQWSKIIGISSSLILSRIHKGYPPELAFSKGRFTTGPKPLPLSSP